MSKMLLLFVYSVGFRLGLLSKGELRGMQNAEWQPIGTGNHHTLPSKKAEGTVIKSVFSSCCRNHYNPILSIWMYSCTIKCSKLSGLKFTSKLS